MVIGRNSLILHVVFLYTVIPRVWIYITDIGLPNQPNAGIDILLTMHFLLSILQEQKIFIFMIQYTPRRSFGAFITSLSCQQY